MDELIIGLIALVVIFPYGILVMQIENKVKLQRSILKKNKGIAGILQNGRIEKEIIINCGDPSFSFENKNFDIAAATSVDREGEFWYTKNGIPRLDFDSRDTRPIPHAPLSRNQFCSVNELIDPGTLQTAKLNETNIFRSILMAAWSFLTQNQYVVPAIMGMLLFAGAAAYFGYTNGEKLDAILPACQAASTAAQTAATQAAQQLAVK